MNPRAERGTRDRFAVVVKSMLRPSQVVVLHLCLLGVAGCDSPAAPDPRIPPAVGTPTSMRLDPCAFDSDVARCPLFARWGELYATELNATDEAQWSSGSPNVVRVVSAGILRAVAPGEAVITAQYRGFQHQSRFRVLSEGPPWRVYTGEYHVQVRDSNDAYLEGVNVEILAGGNAGMHAVSDQFGRAIFFGDSVCGPITVRGTKPGYRDWVGSAIKCGRGGNGNWGSETVGPLRMVPLN